MNKTVLIIDDDDMLRKSLVRGLRNENFTVLDANCSDSGADIIKRITPDAIILDRMMTGTDGLSFLKQLRKSGNKTPVLMLTAMSGPENAIDGLSGGANDYLAKPFQLRELVLRLDNIINKSTVPNPQSPIPNLVFTDNEFFINGKLFALSGEEKKLLQRLIMPTGNTASAQPMVAKRLRGKINSVLSDIDIITVRGKGYKLIYNLQSAKCN
jgi:DNA-binding response OmpR family regulator